MSRQRFNNMTRKWLAAANKFREMSPLAQSVLVHPGATDDDLLRVAQIQRRLAIELAGVRKKLNDYYRRDRNVADPMARRYIEQINKTDLFG